MRGLGPFFGQSQGWVEPATMHGPRVIHLLGLDMSSPYTEAAALHVRAGAHVRDT